MAWATLTLNAQGKGQFGLHMESRCDPALPRLSLRLVTKSVHGHPYHYAVRSARVNRKPRNVEQVYLGKVDDLVAFPRDAPTPTPIQTRRFSAVAALWRPATGIDLVATFDRHCPQRGSLEISIGTYLVLTAINHVVEPRSKHGFADWYEATVLRRLCGVLTDGLTSQRF
jgi:hypothetical protein